MLFIILARHKYNLYIYYIYLIQIQKRSIEGYDDTTRSLLHKRVSNNICFSKYILYILQNQHL